MKFRLTRVVSSKAIIVNHHGVQVNNCYYHITSYPYLLRCNYCRHLALKHKASDDFLSIYFGVASACELPQTWAIYARFQVTLVNQNARLPFANILLQMMMVMMMICYIILNASI